MPGAGQYWNPQTGLKLAAEKKTPIFIGSVVGLQDRLDPSLQLDRATEPRTFVSAK
jgi:hypothetical protein